MTNKSRFFVQNQQLISNMSYRNTQNSLLKKHHDYRYLVGGVLGVLRGVGHGGGDDEALVVVEHDGLEGVEDLDQLVVGDPEIVVLVLIT